MVLGGAQTPGPQVFTLAGTVERTCCDPKDSELCLVRAKPHESGVEARSRCDVQIHGANWA